MAKGIFQDRRGLHWYINDLDGKRNKKITQGQMFLGQERKWKSFEVFFAVPESNCQDQKIQLILDARTTSEQIVSGSEQIVSGHVWYDELSISRINEV